MPTIRLTGEEAKNIFAPALIVATGFLFHVNRLSLLELKRSRLPVTTPNLASCLMILSILAGLLKVYPSPKPHHLARVRFLFYVLKMSLIVGLTEVIFRYLWLKMMAVLWFFCNFTGQYIIVAPQDFVTNYAPPISKFVKIYCFYIIRFILAFLIFVSVMKWLKIKEFLKKIKLRIDECRKQKKEPEIERAEDVLFQSLEDITQCYDTNGLPMVIKEQRKRRPASRRRSIGRRRA